MARSIVKTPFDRVSLDEFKVDTFITSDVEANWIDGKIIICGAGAVHCQYVEGTGKVYINGELVHDPTTPSPTPPA